ncbi:ankyrin repeat domain-containing protein SOWAHD [Dipodomys merriami]|uniref:ankyrin repeat domain-containing protein SOWAHD n=1 Tax=Dipodomys merriami TaxID=94247 RepID=UPI003855E43F
MAQSGASANSESKTLLKPTPRSLRGAPQLRPSLRNTTTLGRYWGHAAAVSQESSFQGSMMLPGASFARRRETLRELLGLQRMAAPSRWLSVGHAKEPSPRGSRGLNGSSGGGLLLEPREHAWILAAAEGRFEVLQELLEAEPRLLLRGDPITGYTLLHWLAKHGYHEEMILVYDFAKRQGLPLDVSATGSGGFTPLHLAALQGHDMVIKVLVGALGADPKRRDHSGHRACHYLRPDAPQKLRELSGAENWETEQEKKRDHNADHNNSNSTSGWMLKRTLSMPAASTRAVADIEMEAEATAAGAEAAPTASMAPTTVSKKKKATGSQETYMNRFVRHLFPFFQDR